MNLLVDFKKKQQVRVQVKVLQAQARVVVQVM